MRHGEFLEIVRGLARLSPGQRKQILDHLASMFDKEPGSLVTFLKQPEACPGCHSRDLVSWGTRKGLRRFRCKSCMSTFTALSGSPLARLSHRERWLQYAGCLLDGLTIRAAAKDCEISIPASFRWRHRFLEMIEKAKPPALQGIIEMDETLFRNSKKGDRKTGRKPHKRGGGRKKDRGELVSVLVVRDRQGTTSEYVFDQFNADALETELGNLIPKDSVVCTDGSTVLASFAKRKGYLQMAITASAGQHILAGPFHIQNVNAYHKRLKEWMERFHGVSTKWLSNYLGWWRMLDGNQSNLTPDEVLRYALA